jgi:hypothetical protein
MNVDVKLNFAKLSMILHVLMVLNQNLFQMLLNLSAVTNVSVQNVFMKAKNTSSTMFGNLLMVALLTNVKSTVKLVPLLLLVHNNSVTVNSVSLVHHQPNVPKVAMLNTFQLLSNHVVPTVNASAHQYNVHFVQLSKNQKIQTVDADTKKLYLVPNTILGTTQNHLIHHVELKFNAQ